MSTKANTDQELIESVDVGSAARPLGVDLPDEFRDRLSDEVIDELLAGARTEEETSARAGCSRS